jgi:hypothetical protein
MQRFAASTVTLVPHAAGVLLWIAAGSAAAQAPDKYRWELADTEDGCQLSTSKVAGMDYFAARSTCVVTANIEVVGRVLRDIESYPEWMFDCSDTKMLKVVDREKDVYVFWFRQHISLLSDRDMVLKSEVPVHDENRRVIEAFSSGDSVYDSGKGYVRMPSFNSEWVLEKIDERQTRVTFMIDPDLGGSLPLGIANSTIKKTPFKSIQGLKKMVDLPKYGDRAMTIKAAKPADEVVPAKAP